MIELSYLYMMREVNEHFERTGYSQRLLDCLVTENNN